MSNNALTLFNYNGSQVRTILDERTGEPWWVAKDVCDVLGITWSGATLTNIPEHWRSMLKLNIEGVGARNVTVITEPAVYKLAFRSNKREADAFTNWVAEIIQTIRKTGSYSVAPTAPAMPALPQTYAEALRALADSTEKVEELQRELAIADAICDMQGAELVEVAPKVEAFEEFLDADGSINYGAAAKLLKVAPKSLTRGLRDQGILYGNTRVTIAKQPYIDKGYFKHLGGGNNGHVWTRSVLTPKGVEWLRGMYWVRELKEL